MSNLVLIFLIAIFFLFCNVFFIDVFFLISSFNICLIKNLAFFFSSMPLIRSCKSHDPGNNSGGLAQFEKIYIFVVRVFFFFFCFYIHRVISILCPRPCVWFVDSSWLWSSLETFFVIFFCFDKFFKFIFLN